MLRMTQLRRRPLSGLQRTAPAARGRQYGQLCGYICTATVGHSRLPASIWREYVAKDCSICKRPVPFERIRRHPRALTCNKVCSVRNEQSKQKRAHKKWRRKRQAIARAYGATVGSGVAKGVPVPRPAGWDSAKGVEPCS